MTREQLDAIRARVEAAPSAAKTSIEIDRDGTTRWVNIGPFLCFTLEDVVKVRDVVTFVHAAPADLRALLAEVERLTAELHRMKSRPVEAEFSRLDTMWQQLVRERDEAVHELSRLKGVRSEVNTAKLNDAFTEGTLKAGEAMRPLVAAAFSRGVAAMREAAVDACRPEYPDAVRRLRSLPDPEDKS